MTPFPVEPTTLKTLYANGQITAVALTAIAPITWLAQHYPELLKSSDTLVKALNILDEQPPITPRTCKDCIHFSRVHECCMTRIDETFTYLPVTAQTPACQDFERVERPSLVNRGQQ